MQLKPSKTKKEVIMENLDNKFAQDVTKNMEGIGSWWRSKEGFFDQAEALVAVCTLLFAIQVVFGWLRRCSSNVFIKYSLLVAYTFTPTVATYTLGFAGSFISAGYNLKELSEADVTTLSTWSFMFLFALGSAYSMVAYDVDDNKKYTRYLVRHALYVLNMVAVIRLDIKVQGEYKLITFLMDCISLLLLLGCFYGLNIMGGGGMCAVSFSDHGSLYLQNHMKNEHLKSTSYDPVTLQGYNYPIFKIGRRDITVSTIWLTKEGILGSSDGARLKEVCLSYALFHLLRRRFFGAACPEATLQKTHDLVFRGLLSNAEENYEYAYRVIETELGFAHDHFFINNYPYVGAFIIIAFGIVKLGLNFLATAEVFILSVLHLGAERRLISTVVIFLVLLALELLQLYIYLSSDNLRVRLASLSSTMPLRGSVSQLCRIQNKLPQLFGHWQNKIGQHSLLKDLHSRSITADVMGSLSWILYGINYPAFSRGIFNPGVKDLDRAPLTCHVKKAIAQTLKSSDGHLSNGALSLERNGQLQLSKEFLLGSHAGDMLIWHIATDYCDIAQSLQTVRQGDLALSNRDVATRLSNYCAYLMAFVPGLLPDHHLETTAKFHRTRKIALQHLQKDKTLEQKYAKLSSSEPPPPQLHENMSDGQTPQQNEIMSDVQPPEQNGSINDDINDGQPASQDVNIFKKGIQLGKNLEGDITDDGRRWKILADFWTEMILYIAPSNNARDHIQHLANGGEFLTHLWALLTHAGILERGQQNVVNAQNAGANQPRQEQAQDLQPDQPHTEDKRNAMNHHEIEEEVANSCGQEADKGAHVHGDGGFPKTPAQGNYDSTASSSTNNRPRVEIV